MDRRGTLVQIACGGETVFQIVSLYSEHDMHHEIHPFPRQTYNICLSQQRLCRRRLVCCRNAGPGVRTAYLDLQCASLDTYDYSTLKPGKKSICTPRTSHTGPLTTHPQLPYCRFR